MMQLQRLTGQPDRAKLISSALAVYHTAVTAKLGGGAVRIVSAEGKEFEMCLPVRKGFELYIPTEKPDAPRPV